MFPDLLSYRESLDRSFGARVPVWEKTVMGGDSIYNVYTTNFTNECAEQMMQQWTELFQYLVVRHNDMALKKVADGGVNVPIGKRFKKTEHGLAEAPDRPGYPEAYRKAIVEKEGEKYLMK